MGDTRYDRTELLDDCLLPIKRTGAFSDLEKEALYKVFECTSFGQPTCWNEPMLLGDTIVWCGTCFKNQPNTFHNLIDTASAPPNPYDGLRYGLVAEEGTLENGTTGPTIVYDTHFTFDDIDETITAEWLFTGTANGISIVGADTVTSSFVPNEASAVSLDYNHTTHVWSVGGVDITTGGGGSSPLTTKGDIYTYDTADQRLAIGADTQVLTADSAEATGMKWAASGSGVTEFLALNDTPASYAGNGTLVVAVNAGETALEFVAGGGGGVSRLVDLTDTSITGVADTQVLTYQSSSGKWINAPSGSGGVTTLAALSDTTIVGTPTTGFALIWDGGTWAPAAVAGGGGTVTSVTGTEPIYITGTNTINPKVNIRAAVGGSNSGTISSSDQTKLDNLDLTPECLYDPAGTARVCASVGRVDVTGTLWSSGAVTAPSYNATSARKYKENIRGEREFDGCVSRDLAGAIDKLTPVTYTLINSTETEIGLIADDIPNGLIHSVVGYKDGEVDSIDYSRLVVPLIAKAKQDTKRIKDLEDICKEQDQVLLGLLDRVKDLEKSCQ